MGCGISKSELEETRQGDYCQIRSLRKRTNVIDEKEDESNSLTHRKSVSSNASEGGAFLRRVLGSFEKERGVEEMRDVMLDSSNNNVGLKSISSSSLLRNENKGSFSFKQSLFETMEKDTTKESIIMANRNYSFNNNNANNNNNNKEMDQKPEASIDHHEEKHIRRPTKHIVEDQSSIMFGQGSPSFRVYCAQNDFSTTTYDDEDNGDEEREEIKLTKEIEKGTGSTPAVAAKRGRRVRGLRNAMYMGGSALGLRAVFVHAAGVKNNIANSLSRGHNSTPSTKEQLN